MSVVIGQFYKTEKKAIARVVELRTQYPRKSDWYVMCGSKGYVVIGEADARRLRPDLFPKLKRSRRPIYKNYKGPLYRPTELADFL